MSFQSCIVVRPGLRERWEGLGRFVPCSLWIWSLCLSTFQIPSLGALLLCLPPWIPPPPPHTIILPAPTYHPPIGDSHVSQILTLSPMLLIYLPTASWVFHGIPTFHAISGTVCSPRHRFTSTLPSSIGLFLFQPSVTFKKSARQQIFDTEPVVYMIFTFQSFKKYHLLS